MVGVRSSDIAQVSGGLRFGTQHLLCKVPCPHSHLHPLLLRLRIPHWYASLLLVCLFRACAHTRAGVAIGLAAEEAANGSAARLVNAILGSVAAGSFFFIVFVEVLAHELATDRGESLCSRTAVPHQRPALTRSQT
jgi:hypothetical protein